MPIERHRSGFMLLMVLTVLTVAAVALAAAAMRSSREALRVASAAEDLQVRWGTEGLRRLCLANPQRLLRSPQDTARALARLNRRVVLGGIAFDIALSDEQAKANVNTLAARQKEGELAQALTALQSPCRKALVVELRPAPPSAGVITNWPMRYAGFSQVFRSYQPAELIDVRSLDPYPADVITCWGSGRVNFKTAPLPVLGTMLAGVLSEEHLTMLTRLAEEKPSCTLDEAIGRLDLTPQVRATGRGLLTDASSCHGLWVVADTGTRRWYRLYVQVRGDGQNDTQSWVYQW